MKKLVWSLTLIFLTGLLLAGTAYHFTDNVILYSMAITFGTTFYHFAMRLAVGYIMDGIFHNHMDYTKKWFQEKSFEPKFYRKLHVRDWKKYVPSFRPQDFHMKEHSITELIQATCQSEIVHEIIMVLSFVPILFSIWFKTLGVFLITSCVACLFDSVFVILQRYNRPRFLRLAKKGGHIL